MKRQIKSTIIVEVLTEAINKRKAEIKEIELFLSQVCVKTEKKMVYRTWKRITKERIYIYFARIFRGMSQVAVVHIN